MPRLAFNDWSADQLRCTAFTLTGTALQAAHWWTRLANADPEEITSNPRLGSSQAVGRFGPRTLVVATQPDRVDWYLVPAPIEAASIQGQPATEPNPPSIGNAIEAFDVFSELSKQWLAFEDVPNINRLALGGMLSHQEVDKRAAYLRLPDYVSFPVDPKSSDFIFQINLPLPSRSIEGLAINRLSKWSVTMFKLFAMNVLGGPFGQDLKTTIALRSEIDINTAQEYQGELPKSQLAQIMDELIDHGRNLITNGVVVQ
ncbi:MAG: hypothetical protein ACYCSP_11460 [Acidobacteriaceae bacterium]